MKWKDLENEWQEATVHGTDVYRRPADERWRVKVEEDGVTISTWSSPDHLYRNISRLLEISEAI